MYTVSCEVRERQSESGTAGRREFTFKNPRQLHYQPKRGSEMTNQGLRRVSLPPIVLLLIGSTFFGEGWGHDGVIYPMCPTTIFNFGDSLSDTGNVVLAFPFLSDSEKYPYGESFFGKPTGRFSNGRLVIDFMALAFGFPFIDPYLQTVAHNYVHGVNFAYAGATSSRDNYYVPFFLGFQVGQFVRFKSLTLEAQQQGGALADFNRYLPAPWRFSSALYMISIGGNDILTSFFRRETPKQIIDKKVPLAVQAIVEAIQILYQQEARNFLVYSVPAEGCSVVFLTLFADLGLPRDELGCLAPVNMLNQALNAALYKSIQDLRSSLSGVTISYFDYYSANLEILKNPIVYGFNPDLKFTACCGASGQGSLNYNPNVTCGDPGSSACGNPDEYINWDGIHFTEAYYRTIARFILNGQYVDPPFSLASACNSSFEDFGETTYSDVFQGSHPLLL